MTKTTIPWVRNSDGSPGYTWNPITGCLGPYGRPSKPQPCLYCYAQKLANGRLRKIYLQIPPYPYYPPLLVPGTDKGDPFVPRLWRHRLREPFRYKEPSTIFVCSMGEIFNDFYPASWLNNIRHTIYGCPQHTFLVLTKNPRRTEVGHLPENVWFGVTINKREDWSRLADAEHCQPRRKFISFEPLFDDVLVKNPGLHLAAFDWIIIGAQTKPYKPPEKRWVEHIVFEANLLRIPVFLKNNLKPLMGEVLMQEFPGGGTGL